MGTETEGFEPETGVAGEKCRVIKNGRVDLHCTLPLGHDKPQGGEPGTWHEAVFTDHQEITYDGARHVVHTTEHVTWEPVNFVGAVRRAIAELGDRA